MTKQINPLRSMLVKVLLPILVLFLCSIPVFYGIVLSSMAGGGYPYLYILARLFRFLLVIAISCIVCVRNQEILVQADAKRKTRFHFIVDGILVSILLHLTGVTTDLYWGLSNIIGIYHSEATPLFLSVLWEQLFAGDLYWGILVGLGIVFFPWRQIFRRNKQRGLVT